MDDGNKVQDENLVNDQVTQALTDSGIDATASTAVPPAPAPEPNAAQPTVPTEEVAPDDPHTGVAEAAQLNTEPVRAPMADEPTPEPAPQAEADETPQIMGSGGLSSSTGDEDELMSVKQKALEQLSPLVDHLDLPPEQKFDTYMEILRASDDKALVQPAFDVAQQIDDDDKRAQALLDVVNEVNYLTQDHNAAE